jgi:PHD/YefM family antitoxin component YafN of YafNO toxin-antitoxin module
VGKIQKSKKILTNSLYVRYDVHIEEALAMIIQNATNFRKNMFSTLEQVTKFNEVAAITTKDGGAAIIINKEDYDAIMETIYLQSVPGLEEDLLKIKNAPASEFISADEVKW